MSFILDALKKLEREKENRDPDVVMVGPVPWGGRDRGRLGRKVALSAAALAVLVAGAFWWASRPHPSRPDTAHEVRSSAPAPSPTPSPTPSTIPSPEATGVSTVSPDTPSLEPPPRRTLSLPQGEGTPVAAGGAVDPAPPSPEVAREVTALPTEGEDATRAADEAEAATDEGAVEFRLSAISSRDGEPVALLNDRLVREGDAFDDVRILRIGTTEVEIEVDGERRTIGF